MSLLAGSRLGSYEIVASIGSGGMGEVYKARDTKLDRDVAIKVLPSELARDPEALARFEREAKAVAALSHPNILAIHDFGRDAASGVSYAVTELLDGATLRARLADGSMPAKKVVDVGVDIAHGLAAAHARGIVHRDLKPENIFVTRDGVVKILDFGLAKTYPGSKDPGLHSDANTNSPTALRQTDAGTVLGTVGYMSPEQVKGQPADHRSDVFSLGCVLYELATGRRAFHRETAAETMTAILREEPPDLVREGSSSPALIEPVIRHCLEKQPDERFQSARDLAFALRSLSAPSTASGKVATVTAPTARKSRALLSIAIASALAVLAFVAGRFSGTAPESAPAIASTFQQLTDAAGVEIDPSISPDGTSVAFASRIRGTWDVFVQRIGGRNPIVVAGDPARGELAPAFSPDGTQIAFHMSGGKGGIFLAGATGESGKRLTDFGFHPAWSKDGQRIAFCMEEIAQAEARSSTSSLWIVETAAAGAAPRKISDGDGVQPSWSPSGKHLVYWAVDTGQRDIFTIPSEGGTRTAITSDAAIDWGPAWSADGRYIYFASNRGGAMNLWRVPVDDARGAATGPPEPVTAGVAIADQPSLSQDGSRVVFRALQTAVNPSSVSFDPVTERVGPVVPVLDRSGSLHPVSVSHDGKWLTLFNVGEQQEDVVVVRTDGTDLRRVTDDPFRDRWPQWSPDGSEIVFYSNRTNNYGIWAIKPDGSGLRQLTDRGAGNDQNLLYPIYSPTGDRMVASRIRAGETLLFDPRKPWKEQQPDSLPVKLADGSFLIPLSWSRDGQRLAGSIVNPAGSGVAIGVFEFATRTTRKVADHPVTIGALAWLPDGRRVIFVTPDTQTLSLLDTVTGQSKTLLPKVNLGVGLAIAPDGRTIYVSTPRLQADVWMVETKDKK